jgi:hypothetical protein
MAEDEGTTGSAPDAIDAGKAQQGLATATGVEAARRAGAQDDIDEAANHSGQPEIAGGEAQPDYLGQAGENKGAQNEPATFVGNGTLDPRMIATPSGPQPAAAVATSAEHGEKLLQDHKDAIEKSNRDRFSSRQRISDEKLSTMGRAEIRAVASDRGYPLSDGLGGRGTRAAFLEHQKNDSSLADDPTEG